MALISQSIKNLKGGISQQPDILRFSDQGAEQINAFSSEVEGLQKRPPSVHVARLGNSAYYGGAPLCHVINRDESERYTVMFTGTDIKVNDLRTGQVVGVNAPNGWGYVTVTNPRYEIRAVTVADYTFVVNRAIKPQSGTLVAPITFTEGRHGLISVKGGQYGRTFKIICNGNVIAEYTLPSGEVPEDINRIDVQYIIGQLVTSFNAGNLPAQGWHMAGGSGYITLTLPEGQTIAELRVEDGYNGQLLIAIVNDIQKTADLPVEAPDKYHVRVTGDNAQGQDDYHLQYNASRKIWQEIPKPGIVTNIEAGSMPHILVREADGTFTFKATEWIKRNSGDDDTNPWPSFIGENINDVFFFRNRLGLLAGENVILSEAGEYFNFFPKSVAASSDADPIDVAVSTNRISVLKYAVPFSEELLLWSDQAQFVLSADGILTPTSAKLDMATEFEVTEHARPFGLGRGVYFVSPRARYSAVRRYYAVQDVTKVKNAEDISSHIPSYIPNGVFKIHGSSTENFISVLTAGAPHKVFIYKFLYLEEVLAQQSWSHWDFGEGNKVLCCELIGAVMYLVLETPSGVFLEKIEFTQHTKDFDLEPYRLYMDRKKTFTIPAGRFNNDNYTTYFNLHELYGKSPESGDYFVVFPDGSVYDFPCPTGGWVTTDGLILFDGNLTGATVIVGKKYCMTYEFSKFLIKQTDAQGGTSTEDIGRLQLRRAWVNFNESGNFRLEVTNQGRDFTYHMTGNQAGTSNTIVGEENLQTGQFRFPIAGNAKVITLTLKSDTPGPVAIIGGGWEGNYVRRSGGI